MTVTEYLSIIIFLSYVGISTIYFNLRLARIEKLIESQTGHKNGADLR